METHVTGTVVIAGAGPVGLFLASELRLAGVEAVVLERSPKANEHTIGGTLHARTADLFDQRGIMDTLRAGKPPLWPRLHFASYWLDLEPYMEDEYSLLLPQQYTEQMLEARAAALGVDVRRGHTLVGLSQDADGVTVTVRADDGDYELRGAYLVGADGADSAVLKLADFDVRESGPRWYGLLADIASVEGEWHAGNYPGGQFAVIRSPHEGGPSRIMTLEFNEGVEPPPADQPVTLDEVIASTERITGRTPVLGEVQWLHRYSYRTREAENYRDGRVFVVGDAAHLHVAFAGHGLNTGLHDAANLGWKLAAVLAGRAGDALLDTYDEERRPVGHRACVFTQSQLSLLTQGEHFDVLRQLFTDLVKLPEVNRHLITTVTEVRYAVDGAEKDDAHPLLGRPVPNELVRTADGKSTALGEALQAGRGALVDLTGGSAGLPATDGRDGHLDRVSLPAADGVDAAALLVRPDGFVAWAATAETGADGLEPALRRWFGEVPA